MRRPFLVGILAVGAVLGFGSALFCSFRGAHSSRHEAFERHVADICAESALRAGGKSAGVSAPAPR